MTGQKQMSLLSSFAEYSIFSAIPAIQSGVCRAQRIAIRTDETKVAFNIVTPIPIDMICYKRDSFCFWINFRPSTEATFIAELSAEIFFNMSGDNTDTLKTGYFSSKPFRNILFVLIFNLAESAAINVAETFRFFAAT